MAAWYCARTAKIRGVGPAGRWFIALKERGRRMVIKIGGRRRVGGRMPIKND